MPSRKTNKNAIPQAGCSLFRIDSAKHKTKTKTMLLSIDPELHRWMKAVAAVNGVAIASALNQAIEYARNNSERISL